MVCHFKTKVESDCVHNYTGASNQEDWVGFATVLRSQIFPGRLPNAEKCAVKTSIDEIFESN